MEYLYEGCNEDLDEHKIQTFDCGIFRCEIVCGPLLTSFNKLDLFSFNPSINSSRITKKGVVYWNTYI